MKKFIGIIFIAVGLFVGSLTVGHALYYAGDDQGNVENIMPRTSEAAVMETGAQQTASLDPVDTNRSTHAQAVKSPAPAPKPANPSWPGRLEIPSIGVNAHVQYVGVNSKGNMGTPSNFTDVAWFKGGAVPGSLGTAVMDGHVDNGLGLSGIFKHLSDVEVGDDVYVVTNAGTKLHYQVYDIEAYPYNSDAADQIFDDDSGAYLNLITCEGTWVPSQKTYDKRLVVFTKLVK